jgi:hypothetical protein
MAKPKTRGCAFELLETRYLLNGASIPAALLVDGSANGNFSAMPPADAVNYGQAVICGPAPATDGSTNSAPGLNGRDPDMTPRAQIPPSIGQSVKQSQPGIFVYQQIIFQPASSNPAPKNQLADEEEVFIQFIQNYSGNALTPAGRDQSNAPGPLHDQNAAAVAKVLGKVDRLPITTDPISGVARGFNGQLQQGSQVALQQNSVPHVQDKDGVAGAPARRDVLETRPTAIGPVEQLSSLAIEETFSSSSVPLTNILPFDFSALELSIKDFFDQIDQCGVKLSVSQVDLLFSSGIMAVAAAIALEIGRRKIHAANPALPLQREGSIPYSDYP